MYQTQRGDVRWCFNKIVCFIVFIEGWMLVKNRTFHRYVFIVWVLVLMFNPQMPHYWECCALEYSICGYCFDLVKYLNLNLLPAHQFSMIYQEQWLKNYFEQWATITWCSLSNILIRLSSQHLICFRTCLMNKIFNVE